MKGKIDEEVRGWEIEGETVRIKGKLKGGSVNMVFWNA